MVQVTKLTDSDLGKLYEIRGWREPDPDQILDAISTYIEERIVQPLENQFKNASPAIRNEAETISLQVGGYAYSRGHEQGWNDALHMISHLSNEFVTDEESTVETFEPINGNERRILLY